MFKIKSNMLIFVCIILIGFFTIGLYYFCKLDQQLIPRSMLFSNPDYTYVRISPDGKNLSYLASHNGQLNLWVRDLVINKEKVITNSQDRRVDSYSWAYDNRHILYTKDTNGDENWKLYKVDVTTRNSTLLTPNNGVQARILKISHLHPTKILIGLNERTSAYHDLYELDIHTGKKTLIFKNNEYLDFFVDDNLKIIFGIKYNKKGEMEYYRPTPTKHWQLFRTVALINTEGTNPIDIDHSGNWIYWLDNEGSDKSNLVKKHLITNERQIIHKSSLADLVDPWIHPINKEPLSVEENYLMPKHISISSSIEKDFKALEQIEKGIFKVLSTSLDLTKWIIVYENDDKPLKYYVYNHISQKAQFLFSSKKDWEDLTFVKMKPIEIKSRDGLKLVSYLSLPKNQFPKKPLPMVLIVHGGPINIRDEWGFNLDHQWLTNRGYAVLSVNYRGSGGFGKNFIRAAYGERARKMHDDLIDAVNWAIKEKIADPNKIAIFGGSYGGYAALVGATMTPDIFACAISEVGISNLVTKYETNPPYWKGYNEIIKIELGADPKTEEGKAFLLRRSPISYVDNIKKPLLIVHGANDSRVKKTESDQIVNAMQKKGIPVTYVLFPDEGHGFINPKNRLANIAIIEDFLHKNLGGSFEPITNEVTNSSAQILAGQAPK